MLKLGLHRAPGRRRQQPRHRFGGGMGTVGGREGVIDEDVTKSGNLAREGGIVLFFAAVKARIFQQRDIAVLEGTHHCVRFGSDAVVGENNGAPNRLGQRFHHRPQRHFGDNLSLGAIKMREHDDARALLGQFTDGRSLALDARCVANLAVFHRHVEIDTHQNASALHIKIVKRSIGHRVRGISPRPVTYRPCGWRSPIRCRTSS